MHPRLLHQPGQRLSPAELSACRIDGVLFDLGEAYIPADVPESAAARALSLRGLYRRELAASGPTAAWVHGAGDRPPGRHHARPVTVKRLRAPSTARMRVHEAPLAEDDVVLIGGLAVSGRLETLTDLARGDAVECLPWLRALVADAPEDALTAADRLSRRARMPGKRAAIEALQAAYDEVTRYTS